MRKKLAACLALVLLALVVTVLAAWWVPPAGPPLRVGMIRYEVDQAMNVPPAGHLYGDCYYYQYGPDWRGNV
jgi:hypothetical protein